MTALRGNRRPLSISDTVVFNSGVVLWRVLASSVRSEGLSALTCTVRKSAASCLGVVTEARSRSPVKSASCTSVLSADVLSCPRVYDRCATAGETVLPLSLSSLDPFAALPDT
jgi:hypothetical protein